MPRRLSRSMTYIFVLSAFFAGAGATALADRAECRANCNTARNVRVADCESTKINALYGCDTKKGSDKEQCITDKMNAYNICVSDANYTRDYCIGDCDTAYPK
jgi:hypothetical protein